MEKRSYVRFVHSEEEEDEDSLKRISMCFNIDISERIKNQNGCNFHRTSSLDRKPRNPGGGLFGAVEDRYVEESTMSFTVPNKFFAESRRHFSHGCDKYCKKERKAIMSYDHHGYDKHDNSWPNDQYESEPISYPRYNNNRRTSLSPHRRNLIDSYECPRRLKAHHVDRNYNYTNFNEYNERSHKQKHYAREPPYQEILRCEPNPEFAYNADYQNTRSTEQTRKRRRDKHYEGNANFYNAFYNYDTPAKFIDRSDRYKSTDYNDYAVARLNKTKNPHRQSSGCLAMNYTPAYEYQDCYDYNTDYEYNDNNATIRDRIPQSYNYAMPVERNYDYNHYEDTGDIYRTPPIRRKSVDFFGLDCEIPYNILKRHRHTKHHKYKYSENQSTVEIPYKRKQRKQHYSNYMFDLMPKRSDSGCDMYNAAKATTMPPKRCYQNASHAFNPLTRPNRRQCCEETDKRYRKSLKQKISGFFKRSKCKSRTKGRCGSGSNLKVKTSKNRLEHSQSLSSVSCIIMKSKRYPAKPRKCSNCCASLKKTKCTAYPTNYRDKCAQQQQQQQQDCIDQEEDELLSRYSILNIPCPCLAKVNNGDFDCENNGLSKCSSAYSTNSRNCDQSPPKAVVSVDDYVYDNENASQNEELASNACDDGSAQDQVQVHPNACCGGCSPQVEAMPSSCCYSTPKCNPIKPSTINVCLTICTTDGNLMEPPKITTMMSDSNKYQKGGACCQLASRSNNIPTVSEVTQTFSPCPSLTMPRNNNQQLSLTKLGCCCSPLKLASPCSSATNSGNGSILKKIRSKSSIKRVSLSETPCFLNSTRSYESSVSPKQDNPRVKVCLSEATCSENDYKSVRCCCCSKPSNSSIKRTSTKSKPKNNKESASDLKRTLYKINREMHKIDNYEECPPKLCQKQRSSNQNQRSSNQNQRSSNQKCSCCCKKPSTEKCCCIRKPSTEKLCCNRKPSTEKICCNRKPSTEKCCCNRKSSTEKCCCNRKSSTEKLCCNRKPSTEKICCNRKPSTEKCCCNRKPSTEKCCCNRKPSTEKCCCNRKPSTEKCCCNRKPSTEKICCNRKPSTEKCCCNRKPSTEKCCCNRKPSIEKCCCCKKPSTEKLCCIRKPSIEKCCCCKKPSTEKLCCNRKPSTEKICCNRKPSTEKCCCNRKPSIEKCCCCKKPSTEKLCCIRKPSIEKCCCCKKPSTEKLCCNRKPSTEKICCNRKPSTEKCCCNKKSSRENVGSTKNSNREKCSCNNKPSQENCSCNKKPSREKFSCIQKPSSEKCCCNKKPTIENCSCNKTPSRGKCSCCKKPSKESCSCCKKPTKESCSCNKKSSGPKCCCNKKPSGPKCCCNKKPSGPKCCCNSKPSGPKCCCNSKPSGDKCSCNKPNVCICTEKAPCCQSKKDNAKLELICCSNPLWRHPQACGNLCCPKKLSTEPDPNCDCHEESFVENLKRELMDTLRSEQQLNAQLQFQRPTPHVMFFPCIPETCQCTTQESYGKCWAPL